MLKSWMSKSIGVVVLVGILAALVAGTALAQEEAPQGPMGRGHGPRGHVQQIAEATGLTVEEVVAELQSGKTPAEVLAENGVDVDTFVADALAGLEARLDDAVANGLMDQARADEILANASEHLPEKLNEVFEPRGDGQGPPAGDGPKGGQRPFGPGLSTQNA